MLLQVMYYQYSIVESMYKHAEDLFLESGLAPSWKIFSGYNMSVLPPFPKINVHGREHQKVQKLYLKSEKKKRHGMKEVQFLIKVIFIT